MTYICKTIGEAACYEQLAEECAELAKEALKASRILRGENPTPALLEEVKKNVEEEYTDVALVAETLELKPNPVISNIKYNRWMKRIWESKNV